jgi:hypothetical protein
VGSGSVATNNTASIARVRSSSVSGSLLAATGGSVRITVFSSAVRSMIS